MSWFSIAREILREAAFPALQATLLWLGVMIVLPDTRVFFFVYMPWALVADTILVYAFMLVAAIAINAVRRFDEHRRAPGIALGGTVLVAFLSAIGFLLVPAVRDFITETTWLFLLTAVAAVFALTILLLFVARAITPGAVHVGDVGQEPEPTAATRGPSMAGQGYTDDDWRENAKYGLYGVTAGDATAHWDAWIANHDAALLERYAGSSSEDLLHEARALRAQAANERSV